MDQMDWWQAVVLGLVEGLTEYLPISSTGHLILAQQAIGIPEGKAANAYAICIQAGAILAVLGLYWPRVRQMLRGLAGRIGWGAPEEDGLRLAVNVVVAFFPAAVIGLLFDEQIEQYLLGLWPIVAAWFLGGAAILWVARDRRLAASAGGRSLASEKTNSRRDLVQLTWKASLAIGLMQCLAMWPGTSRSLVTIVGGVVVGLSLSAAVEFSFLLGVVTLLAATGYKAIDAGPVMYEAYGLAPMLLGTLAAWISAVIAVKWMVTYLRSNGMELFGYYRIGIAGLVAACLLTGRLANRSAASATAWPQAPAWGNQLSSDVSAATRLQPLPIVE
jgi:undecaprenyl-diphosphatase